MYLPSDHRTIRALLSRTGFPSSSNRSSPVLSFSVRHLIVFSTYNRYMHLLRYIFQCFVIQFFWPQKRSTWVVISTDFKFQSSSSFLIKYFVFINFILVCVWIEWSIIIKKNLQGFKMVAMKDCSFSKSATLNFVSYYDRCLYY